MRHINNAQYNVTQNNDANDQVLLCCMLHCSYADQTELLNGFNHKL
jgi:hypothetical protein